MKQMYKVFLNDRLIRIEAPGEITINKPTVSFDFSAGKQDVKKWFNDFKNSNLSEILLLNPDPQHFFEVFKSAFKVIQAAGGVVLGGENLLFIFRRGKWDLPKGKIDKGENPEQAAVREVTEECGISGHIISGILPSTYHIYPSPFSENKGTWILKETFWFEMRYKGALTGVPQTEEDITMVKWMAPKELDVVFSNTFENLKQIIGLYCG
jgi:8-oxo-dGTP pyrophosphatase MutT (NUDIX family)